MAAPVIKSDLNVEYVDHMGDDMSIVNAARVSFANANDSERTDAMNEKLITYLADHKHITPFQHTAITVRMQAPVPIRTQCFKHKVGFSENEESRRYIDTQPEIFIPNAFRAVTDSKKQGSGGVLGGKDQFRVSCHYSDAVNAAVAAYEKALEMGVCEEQARFLLPQGAIVNWYWTGSIAAFARFFHQRTDPHAQKEIQVLAHQVGEVIEPLFPITWKALTK